MDEIKKILFVSLSNIGDAVLTLPALDLLKSAFAQSDITVVVADGPKELFLQNRAVSKTIIFDKRASFRQKLSLLWQLKKERFDAVVDLRNSLFGVCLACRYKTTPLSFVFLPASIRHMRDRNLYITRRAFSPISLPDSLTPRMFCLSQKQEAWVDEVWEKFRFKKNDIVVAVAAGAKSHTKRWPVERFVLLIERLLKDYGVKIVLVGDKNDISIAKFLIDKLNIEIINLVGQTTLLQLAALLKRVKVVVSNDSGVLHLASYLGVKVVAIFGPSSEEKYGPWSEGSVVVKKEVFCRPCQEARCRYNTLDCMKLVKVEDVLSRLGSILEDKQTLGAPKPKDIYKRILIVRTDRIGDVILSTPVITAARQAWPNAYIAMMVSPLTRELVEGNPYLDEVIVYDKDDKQKSWLASFLFSQKIKRYRFDLALILHPTSRVHLVTFFAGIKRRVGYNRKLGFLLTDRIAHLKQEGLRHELDYTLDIVRHLGVEPQDKKITIPLTEEAKKEAARIFLQEGIDSNKTLVAIHPGASCPSKVWPSERFAAVADRLISDYGCLVLFVCGPKDIKRVEAVLGQMKNKAFNLAGRLSLMQLAAVLGRCKLFISCDSGPVHISAGVGTPVISIFGRNQAGLSPRRWGPLGPRDRVIHKDVSCLQCLAHNCKNDFACLKAITPEEVLDIAEQILRG